MVLIKLILIYQVSKIEITNIYCSALVYEFTIIKEFIFKKESIILALVFSLIFISKLKIMLLIMINLMYIVVIWLISFL